MDRDELTRFLPVLLANFDPRSITSEDGSHYGWLIEAEDAVVLVRASLSDVPFIWIQGGIAFGVPTSAALAFYIASRNRVLEVGRVYMDHSEDAAMVVFDETIFAAPISPEHRPSMQDAWDRVNTSVLQTVEWSRDIRERFGGHPFTGEDWVLMRMSSFPVAGEGGTGGIDAAPASSHTAITPRALFDLVTRRYPDREPPEHPDLIDELIDDLQEAGMTSIEEVADMLDRTRNAFDAYEREEPPGGEPGSRFACVGVVRISLGLARAG